MAKKTKDVRIVDLNDINFRNKDVIKWGEPTKLTKPKGTSSRPLGLKQLGSVTQVAKLKNA